MKKHKAKALEFAWGEPEAFRLEFETAIDGERLQREAKAKQADREQGGTAQLLITLRNPLP